MAPPASTSPPAGSGVAGGDLAAVDLDVRGKGLARDSGQHERVAEGHLWAGKALTWHGRGSRAADILTGSGVDSAVPQCAVLRLSIARARGLNDAEAATRAAALVDRLDRQAVAASVRAPSVLAERWEAFAAGGPQHDGARRRLRDTARAFVDRRVAGAEEPETRAGFLAVPSVVRLVRLLDAS